MTSGNDAIGDLIEFVRSTGLELREVIRAAQFAMPARAIFLLYLVNGSSVKLLVLAGGFGTRLQSVVGDVPKALAPIGDLPFLKLQIEQWISEGIDSFVFLLHHQADQVVSFLESHSSDLLKNCDVNWSIEPEPLQSGGAVALSVRKFALAGELLVVNADTWLGGGIRAVTSAGAPSIAVVRVPSAGRYGTVEFDGNSKVTRFLEKSQDQSGGWIYAGLCCIHAELFEAWDGLPFSLERQLFPGLIERNLLKAVPLRSDFIDIGIPSDYYRFCEWNRLDRKGDLCS